MRFTPQLGRIVLLGFLLLGVSAGALAETAAPARIDGTVVWKKADSPLLLSQDLLIAAGASLRIEPGVTIQVKGPYSITVEGELLARGTKEEPILFTKGPEQTKNWKSVIFNDAALDAAFTDLDTYASGSILEWCIFEYGTVAVKLDHASPYLYHSVFRNNESVGGVDVIGGAGLLIANDSAPRIRECEFTDNIGKSFNYGGGIYVTKAAPIIQDCLFKNNSSAYGGGLSTDSMMSPIVGNTFSANSTKSEGGGVSLLSTSSAFLNNTLTGNKAPMDGAGLHVCVDCFPHAYPFVMDNTISTNVSTATDPKKGAAGLGAAYLRVCRYNTITDNLRDGKTSNFGWYQKVVEGYPSEVQNPNIDRNWWGTSDPSLLAETIFDGTDDPAYGVVTYNPPLSAAPKGPALRATITTRKIRYLDEGDPMGVFLTLYNPGARREIELVVMLAYEGAPPLPYSAPLNGLTAVSDNGAYRLTLPANSVYFSQLFEPPYHAGFSSGKGVWQAVVFDAASGERLGDVCLNRFWLGEGSGE